MAHDTVQVTSTNISGRTQKQSAHLVPVANLFTNLALDFCIHQSVAPHQVPIALQKVFETLMDKDLFFEEEKNGVASNAREMMTKPSCNLSGRKYNVYGETDVNMSFFHTLNQKKVNHDTMILLSEILSPKAVILIKTTPRLKTFYTLIGNVFLQQKITPHVPYMIDENITENVALMGNLLDTSDKENFPVKVKDWITKNQSRKDFDTRFHAVVFQILWTLLAFDRYFMSIGPEYDIFENVYVGNNPLFDKILYQMNENAVFCVPVENTFVCFTNLNQPNMLRGYTGNDIAKTVTRQYWSNHFERTFKLVEKIPKGKLIDENVQDEKRSDSLKAFSVLRSGLNTFFDSTENGKLMFYKENDEKVHMFPFYDSVNSVIVQDSIKNHSALEKIFKKLALQMEPVAVPTDRSHFKRRDPLRVFSMFAPFHTFLLDQEQGYLVVEYAKQTGMLSCFGF